MGLCLYMTIFSVLMAMVNRSSQDRVLSLVQAGSYGTESPEDLRQLEERDYVKRLKEELQERQMAFAYRTITGKEPFINEVTQI